MLLLTRTSTLLFLAALVVSVSCARDSTEGELVFPFSRYWGFENDEYFIDLAETVEPQDLFDLTVFTDVGLEPGATDDEASRRLGPPIETIEIHANLTAYRFSSARGPVDIVASISESEGHRRIQWSLRTDRVSTSESFSLDRLLNDLPGDASDAELFFVSDKASVALDLDNGMPQYLWWIRSKPRT